MIDGLLNAHKSGLQVYGGYTAGINSKEVQKGDIPPDDKLPLKSATQPNKSSRANAAPLYAITT